MLMYPISVADDELLGGSAVAAEFLPSITAQTSLSCTAHTYYLKGLFLL